MRCAGTNLGWADAYATPTRRFDTRRRRLIFAGHAGAVMPKGLGGDGEHSLHIAIEGGTTGADEWPAGVRDYHSETAEMDASETSMLIGSFRKLIACDRPQLAHGPGPSAGGRLIRGALCRDMWSVSHTWNCETALFTSGEMARMSPLSCRSVYSGRRTGKRARFWPCTIASRPMSCPRAGSVCGPSTRPRPSLRSAPVRRFPHRSVWRSAKASSPSYGKSGLPVLSMAGAWSR